MLYAIFTFITKLHEVCTSPSNVMAISANFGGTHPYTLYHQLYLHLLACLLSHNILCPTQGESGIVAGKVKGILMKVQDKYTKGIVEYEFSQHH